tara:strand:+ start:28 stop:237 length:210 start_codon:yes stop_codon:yes gene_type:complete
MKVGDFVELSAYGKRLKCNKEMVNKVGLVLEVDPIAGMVSHNNAVMVAWTGGELARPSYHIRQDLKYIK